MDHHSPETNTPAAAAERRSAAEPARSRWAPKPEQILILESIFNSGMVNPPKEETVRIRQLLEKFGPVGDANVFYWFQNRRSRSRRRQRQLQASLAAATAAAGATEHEPAASCSSTSAGGFFPTASSSSSFVGDESADDLFSISRQIMGLMTKSSQAPFVCSSDASQLQYQAVGAYRQKGINLDSPLWLRWRLDQRVIAHEKFSFSFKRIHGMLSPGTITVFINGLPSEVPIGPIDMRAMFGQDVMLVHSSGELLPVNEYGILLQGLHTGESYFLVSKPT